MADSPDSRELFERLCGEISYSNILESVDFFNTLFRYSGSPSGEAAVDYIVAKMNEYGVRTRRECYNIYRSLPLEAEIVFDGESIPAIAAVYSGEAENLEGELCFFHADSDSFFPLRSTDEAFSRLKGRIVVVDNGGGSFAKKARNAGALAVIQIQSAREEVVHHSTLGTVWGTPGVFDADSFSFIPYVCVTRSVGETLKARIASSNAHASVRVRMDNSILKTSMPIAEIRGKRENFVLVSAHYDSWYEGITDNAASDAMLIELARVLQKNQSSLERSVVIGWWSGHSDARYSGSAWYCDAHWEELAKNCVAHINIDLAGCKNADQIRARTALTESREFTASLIEKYTGRRAEPRIPMPRGADQSFWGAGVPISIMLKYEPVPEKRNFDCPSGGAWWHTDQDTRDKLDTEILKRDMLFNAEMVCAILNGRRLPVEIPPFIDEMRKFLSEIEEATGGDPSLRPVLVKLDGLSTSVDALVSNPRYRGPESDEINKRVAGELTRLVFSYSSPYDQDWAIESKPFPLLQKVAGTAVGAACVEDSLFSRTEFVRQRNRLLGQIEKVIRDIDHQLLRWKLEGEVSSPIAETEKR